MTYIKQLVLALAFATSACTVQAAPQQQMQYNLGTVLNNWLKFGTAAGLAYYTTQQISYRQFVRALSDVHTMLLKDQGLGFFERTFPKLDFYKTMIDNKDIIKPAFYGARVLTGVIAFRAYRRMLTRALG